MTDQPIDPVAEKPPGRDPVRLATLVVLALCVVLFLTYLRADRVMPYSDQARVIGYTVSVVPQVSGYLTDIEVGLHEVVEPGRVLVRIDTTQYQIAARSARATLDNTIQQLGVADAGVESGGGNGTGWLESARGTRMHWPGPTWTGPNQRSSRRKLRWLRRRQSFKGPGPSLG